MMGHFRDYDGECFEIQRGTFENVAAALVDKIPHFSLFLQTKSFTLSGIFLSLSS